MKPLISIEVEAESRAAVSALTRELGRALKEVGLHGTVSASATYSGQADFEERSLPGPGETRDVLVAGAALTGLLVVKRVIVRATNDAGDAVYEAMKHGFARWRRETGNDATELLGPDGSPLDEWIERNRKQEGNR
jgi:hypothetical protein